MSEDKLQKYEGIEIRSIWDDLREEWYFSVVDVIGVLTEQNDKLTARKYWNKLKQRLKEEGSELVTNCHQLKLRAADGNKRLIDAMNVGRIIVRGV